MKMLYPEIPANAILPAEPALVGSVRQSNSHYPAITGVMRVIVSICESVRNSESILRLAEDTGDIELRDYVVTTRVRHAASLKRALLKAEEVMSAALAEEEGPEVPGPAKSVTPRQREEGGVLCGCEDCRAAWSGDHQSTPVS